MAMAFALLGATAAHASVVINTTRIVYPQNDKEVTVRLESKNRAPVLIQAWLDNGDEHSTPDLANVPFIATPPKSLTVVNSTLGVPRGRSRSSGSANSFTSPAGISSPSLASLFGALL